MQDYLCDVIRFWVREFDVDGIRLDAADVLDFGFMRVLRQVADVVKPDFWLMGEVIHGDYSRWVNGQMLHSVTDYALHKALFSAHNDRNYFEIAHTVQRTRGMLGAHARLYNFVDNHDVERIATKLANKAHYLPVHVLLYTLPGIPSVYYGSEFGIEGKKERLSDDSLRPRIDLAERAGDYEANPCILLVAALGKIRGAYAADLAWGGYRELHLTTEQYAFARGNLIVAVNNADCEACIRVEAHASSYMGLLGGKRIETEEGRMDIALPAFGGEIFAPADCVSVENAVKGTGATVADSFAAARKAERKAERRAFVAAKSSAPVEPVEMPDIPYEQMSVEQLQAAILGKLAENGPVTDRMRRDVADNVWPESLITWVKSFL